MAGRRPDAPVACPFCGSEDTERLSPFAQSLLTSQYRCRSCRTYFEHVRWQGRQESGVDHDQPDTAPR